LETSKRCEDCFWKRYQGKKDCTFRWWNFRFRDIIRWSNMNNYILYIYIYHINILYIYIIYMYARIYIFGVRWCKWGWSTTWLFLRF
jgi:hypothetical protein